MYCNGAPGKVACRSMPAVARHCLRRCSSRKSPIGVAQLATVGSVLYAEEGDIRFDHRS